ncbi:MAG: phage Gp37/Gp68 family protein [Chitinophagaceae bacterium]|nr:MAG: phage Gp37/Gp68 family protein [Chitinophagaceae bacterium]
MNTSKIEWTDKTWNPVTGCTKVSQGCKFCYAETFYERFHGKGSFKNITCHDDRLTVPLNWKKPSMIFVNSMSDLFHEKVPFDFIYKIFEMMHLAHWHTFQVLTKRAERLHELNDVWLHLKRNYPGAEFPSKNVWIGVSVEDQKAADERIPLLVNSPAAIRFLSCEPLLGPVNLNLDELFYLRAEKIHWVICGGESGNKARPMHPEWAKSLRNQCEEANVSFFFKQWGSFGPTPGIMHHKRPFLFEDGTKVYKNSKARNGRMLDDCFYDQYPQINHH